MAIRPYPQLSIAGFLYEADSIAQAIMVDYSGTNYSQSELFYRQLQSIDYALQQNTNNPTGFASMVNRDLETMFLAYIDNASVNAYTKPIQEQDGSESLHRFELIVDVRYVNELGLERNLGQSIITNGSIIERLHDIVIR